MLAKKHKLDLSQQNFKSLMQLGWQWRGENLQAAYGFRNGTSQAAVIASKALIPKASARNLIRRKIFSLLEPIILKTAKLQIILRVTSGRILKSKPEEIDQQLQSLFQEIKENTPHG